MITIITGLPGAGKTSNTLHRFLQEKDRPRFASFINGFDYDAHNVGRLDTLENWQDLPDGSLVFIDEAQQFLRPRGPKAEIPGWIAAFETHRHRGFDFWLTTQNPMLIDIHVRRLTQEHLHYFRPWGFKTVSLLRWEECKDNPRDPREIHLAQKERVKLPPSVFQHYKSTVIDTHKVRVPRKLVIAGLALTAAFAVVLYGVNHFAGRFSEMRGGQATNTPDSALVASMPVASEHQGLYSASIAMNQRQKLAVSDLQPVHPLAPWSAPLYADISRPTNFPRFAGCIAIRNQCKCYTQQGTRLDVDVRQCVDVVMFDGMPFNPHRPDSPDQPSRQAAPPGEGAAAGGTG